MSSRYHQGKFVPKNPQKYNGDLDKIFYRSGWELSFFVKCDSNPNILKWSSECVVIPYRSPLDGRFHRYFMDIWLKMKDRHGNIKESIIEIKPYNQTQKPKAPKRRTKSWKNSVETYAVNIEKWKAAKKYANKRGIDFKILTEKGIITI